MGKETNNPLVRKRIACAQCNKEIPLGFMGIEYRDKLFDSYVCLAVFEGLDLDVSLPSIMKESSLRTIMKQ